MPGVLDARERDEAIRKLAAGPLDVLVIGGGITGAGAALDAASRGLRVGLVEARDLAAGTSSRSSKLIHGGLRYLEQGDFKLVKEALRERDLLVSRLAPHLVRPVPFLYPLYRKVVERPYVGAGLVIYDAMEGIKRPVPHHRHLTIRGALRRAPALRPDRLAGAMLYYDAQVDDARYTVTVARTAVRHGATVLTRASAVSLLRDGSRVTGARVRDEESGRTFDVTATSTVVCAGVWSDPVFAASGVRAGYQVRMSKGVHLVMPRSAIDVRDRHDHPDQQERAVLHPVGRPVDRRHDRHRVVGRPGRARRHRRGRRLHPRRGQPGAGPAAVARRTCSRSTPGCGRWWRSLRRSRTPKRADAQGRDDGGDGGGSEKPTTKLSREHVVDAPLPGLVSIAGGKFTTYRLMAKDVVDAAVENFPRPVPPSVTGELPLLGADGLPAVRASAQRLADDYGVPAGVGRAPGRPVRLDRGRGPRADPGGQVARRSRWPAAAPTCGPRSPTRSPTRARCTSTDVLARRVRLLIESADSGASVAPEVAAIMAPLLGWNRRRRAAEVREYQAFAATNAAALRAPAAIGDASAKELVPA